MDNKVEIGEIVFCDLIINYKGTKHKLKKVVYKNDGNLFYNRKHLQELKIKEPVKVEDVKIISRLGFENKAKGFTEVKANTEIRNKITGVYE
jgi:hypothetical protein